MLSKVPKVRQYVSLNSKCMYQIQKSRTKTYPNFFNIGPCEKNNTFFLKRIAKVCRGQLSVVRKNRKNPPKKYLKKTFCICMEKFAECPLQHRNVSPFPCSGRKLLVFMYKQNTFDGTLLTLQHETPLQFYRLPRHAVLHYTLLPHGKALKTPYQCKTHKPNTLTHRTPLQSTCNSKYYKTLYYLH